MADNVGIDEDQLALFIKEIRYAEDELAAAAKITEGIAAEPRSRWGDEWGPAKFHELFVPEMDLIKSGFGSLGGKLKELTELAQEAVRRTGHADSEQELLLRIQKLALPVGVPESKSLGMDVSQDHAPDQDQPRRGHFRMEAE